VPEFGSFFQRQPLQLVTGVVTAGLYVRQQRQNTLAQDCDAPVVPVKSNLYMVQRLANLQVFRGGLGDGAFE
jgi:hypothetical protein